MTARNAVIAAALVPAAALASSGPIGEALLLAFFLFCGTPALLAAAAGAFVRRVGYWRSLAALTAVIAVEFTVLAYIDHLERIVGPALFAMFVAALIHGIIYGSLCAIRRMLHNTNPKTAAGDP